jgi:ribosomal protein L30E
MTLRMIKCQICNREFDKLISSTHLKSHNISSNSYKKLYGNKSLASPEYRAARSAANSGSNNPNYGNSMSKESKQTISDKNSGKTPHNKGIKLTNELALANLRAGITRREERYFEGEIHRPSPYERTREIRDSISSSVKQYALNNKEVIKARAKKAVETKIKGDFDFGSTMRGKTHTQETKDKISAKIRVLANQTKENTKKEWTQKIEDYGYAVLNWDDFLVLKCKKCNFVFERTLQAFYNSKYDPSDCSFCLPSNSSKAELEILNFVKEFYPSAHKNRSVLHPKELDVYIPELNLAIEYCGLYWHSESNGVNKKYHQDKFNQCLENKIKLITIFEDEWLYSKEKVKNRLLVALNQTERIFGRKSKIKKIENKEAVEFLNQYHMMDSGRPHQSYGLFYNNELISVMSFKKGEKSRKQSGWEISRYASKNNISVIGGAQRLFKQFVLDNNPEEIISYADLRWGDGSIYSALGFEKLEPTVPGYWYFKTADRIRIHRFKLRKKKDEPEDQTEVELRRAQGFHRIWDCGHNKYIWKKEKG